MPKAHKNIRQLISAGLLTLVFSVFALGGATFALPTVQLSSGSGGDFHFHHGKNHRGPQLSSGSSSWEEDDKEHVDDDWSGPDDGDYGDDDDDNNTSPVPEPTTALLMSLGLAGAACLKRRRK